MHFACSKGEAQMKAVRLGTDVSQIALVNNYRKSAMLLHFFPFSSMQLKDYIMKSTYTDLPLCSDTKSV